MIILFSFLISFVYAGMEVQYIRNYDGDTITFNIGKLRILGIDTPELNSKKPCESDI